MDLFASMWDIATNWEAEYVIGGIIGFFILCKILDSD